MKDFLGDMITRIRNGHRARLGAIFLHPFTSKICISVLEILREEGYIFGFQYIWNSDIQKTQIKVLLKYDWKGCAVIKSFFQISRPSRRVYVSLNSLWKPKNSYGIFILFTKEGLMIDQKARLKNLGGEVLCSIY